MLSKSASIIIIRFEGMDSAKAEKSSQSIRKLQSSGEDETIGLQLGELSSLPAEKLEVQLSLINNDSDDHSDKEFQNSDYFPLLKPQQDSKNKQPSDQSDPEVKPDRQLQSSSILKLTIEDDYPPSAAEAMDHNSTIRNILMQTYQQEIELIIKASKLKNKNQVQEALFGELPIHQVSQNVKGLYVKKFIEDMHRVKRLISLDRISMNLTDRKSQLVSLLVEYNMDKELSNETDKQISRQIWKKQGREAQEILARLEELNEAFAKREALMKEEQPKPQQLRIEVELADILTEAGIDESEEVNECLNLFQQRKVQQMLDYSTERQREQFRSRIQQLIHKIQQSQQGNSAKPSQNELNKSQTQQKESLQARLTKILKKGQVKQCDIPQCLALFQARKYSQIRHFSAEKLREQLSHDLEELIRQSNSPPEYDTKQYYSEQVKKKVSQIFTDVQVAEQNMEKCISLFKGGSLEQLLKHINKKHHKKFKQMIGQVKDYIKTHNKQHPSQKKQDFNVEQELISMLKAVQIRGEEEISEALALFRDNNLIQLKELPSRKYKDRFGQLLDDLVTKAKKSHSDSPLQQTSEVQKELISILRKVNIIEQKQIKECLDYFRRNELEQLREFPQRRYRPEFNQLLNQLFKKINQRNMIPQQDIDWRSELAAILKQADITDEQEIRDAIALFEKKQLQELKIMPKRSYRDKFAFQIDSLVAKMQSQQHQQREEINIEKELKIILKNAEIEDEEDIIQCIKLFNQKDLQELKSFPKKKFRNTFAQAIDALIKRISHTDNQTNKQSSLSEEQQLINLLKNAQITNEEQVRQCLESFRDGDIEKLKTFPAKRYRIKFQQGLDKLLQRKGNKQEFSIEQELRKIFKKFAVTQEKQIKQGIKYFENNKLEEILEFIARKERPLLQKMLKQLKLKVEAAKPREKTIQQIFSQCRIDPSNHKNNKADLQKGKCQFLLKIPNKNRRIILKFIQNKYDIKECSLEVHLKLALTPFLQDEEIEQILQSIKEAKDYKDRLPDDVVKIIEQLQNLYSTQIAVRFNGNKQKSFIINQLVLKAQKNILQQTMAKLTRLDMNEVVVFLQKKRVDLKILQLKPQQKYTFQLCELRQYSFRYKNKTRKINLLPDRQLYYNKSLILLELQEKKDVILSSNDDFTADMVQIKLIANGKTIEPTNHEQLLREFQEEKGQISSIGVEIKLTVAVYYEDIKDEYQLSSDSQLIELRRIINQKHVPFKSQILSLIQGPDGKKQEIDEQKDNQLICQLSPNRSIVFELVNRCSFEFYGFHQNIPLKFQSFAEFFVEDEDSTKKLIEYCSFTRKKQEQREFIQHFFSYLYSAIKKRFPIKTVIDKFKILVSRIKYESIWNPGGQNETIKVNDAFVLCYILKNADERLRIELMNLLRQNMSIPLYFKYFEDISKVPQQDELQLNEQLLWILKEGFTIASFGIHNQATIEQEKGKSNLLNEIFPTHFEEAQNKHAIIKGLPYIAIRVFQDIFPMHVIDIPHNTELSFSRQILENSNMAIIHSWKSEGQTEAEVSRIKEEFQIPIICLIRDSKEKNSLKGLKGNYIMEERPQKIINLSKKETCKLEINLLKEQIYMFIKAKMAKNADFNKIFGLYKQNQTYRKFSSVLASLEKQMFRMSANENEKVSLTPIGDQLYKLRRQEKAGYDQAIIADRKQKLKNMLIPQIKDIFQFLVKEEVRHFRSLMLNLLRQKLKTYQSSLNIKYIKIYELRDKFQSIKEIADKKQRAERIQQLNQCLSSLVKLYPKDIVGKDNEFISGVIKKMIDEYENEVKPKIFSVELFWRELNYLISIDQKVTVGNLPLLNVLRELKEVEINSNLPFEIIDGDMLEMPRKLMMKLFENKEERAIVITILGPQSSGKSTLLNFLFGCDFATSEGRCTRGVYGTYFRFAENKGQFNNLTNCEGIFVIDTEGLFAITNDRDRDDEDRKDFDSKLVLFCLAVSDFVIVNVRGNFDKNTEKIIRLCHQRLEDLNIQKDRRPELIVTLNIKTADNKEECEIEFKEIKKSIDFEISKSLSLAYQIRNYGQQEISLFGKNQKLTKKYPLQAFFKETSNLMNEILRKIAKKKGINRLCDIIQKFERIWSVVVAFPNLSKSVTNEYRDLQKKIKQWKDMHDEDEKDGLQKMFDDFKCNKITENKIIEEIELNQKKLIQIYDKQFKEKTSDEEEIKFLIRQQRSKITSKTLVTVANAKYELENIKLKKQIKISKIEGDFMLKEKAKEIYNNSVIMTEEELKNIFDKEFSEQLAKIQLTTNLGEEVIRQYRTIYDNYLFLIRQQTGSEKGLPKEKAWIGDDKCSIQAMLQSIREKIIEPNQKRYEDILIHTNKIHTNVLKGGRTDATLEYFNMKDYFKTEAIIQYYIINKSYLQSYLKKEVLKEMYKNSIEEANKKVDISQFLKGVWEDINLSLKAIGLKFKNFEDFKELFEIYEGNRFARFVNFFKSKKEEIRYEFLKTEKQDIFKKQKYKCSNYYCKCRQKNVYHQRQVIDNSKFTFSKYLNQFIEQYERRCLSSYKPFDPASYLLPRFYKHINWDAILREAQLADDYKHKIDTINRSLTELINQDIKILNLKITNTVDFQQYFDYHSNVHINFELAADLSIPVSGYEQICNLVEQTMFINPKQFKNALRRSQGRKNMDYYSLPIFSIKNEKLEPVTNISYFSSYLNNNTKLTIRQLNRPEFKEFIFQELKGGKRKSLESFFFNIFRIVEDTIRSWKKVEKKTYIEIYNKANQQICKFNNDLNQISCNLSDKYIGYINLAVVYMIWKLIINQKIQEKREIYDAKLKEKENEWNLFKARTSKDEDSNVEGDINQFFKEFIALLNDIITKRKEEQMILAEKDFHRQNNRLKIQKLIDVQIFKKGTSQQAILDYLQNPEAVISKKYASCYEQSWENVELKFSTERTARNVIKEFYDIMATMLEILTQNDIDENKKSFSDFFEIVEKDIKLQSLQKTQKDYQQQGKRVLFQYFIDTLISEDPLKLRKCANVDVKPLCSLKIITQTSLNLRSLLTDIKSVKFLSLTNLVKFVKKLLTPETRNRFNEELEKISKLTEKDKLSYINRIRVVVCKQKCPCCGRICGLEDDHQYHQCIYGHQMRGLNGTYIERQNNTKEASVIRCEQLGQTDIMKYNGTEYSWIQFKEYWKNKKPGGWLFDDAKLTNNANQQRFEDAWTIAGPLYCQKNNLLFVSYNKAEAQKLSAASGPVHYIFALDQSGSMSGSQWNNLLRSFKQTIDKIKAKDVGRNNIKVSLMKFDDTVTVVCQNYSPSQINTNLSCRSGGTYFDPPFNKAAEIAARYITGSVVVFIFMTDGGASYPTNGIQALKRLQIAYPNKLKYAGIQFSSSVQVMKTICSELKGTSGVAYNVDQLTELFMKSIEVIEFRQKKS